MTSPAPSDGESNLDPQSETVSAPHRDTSTPVRTKRTGPLAGGLVAVWVVLGVALVVLAVAALA
ncbi:hypothetical protein [Nocardioides mesophilus]|uniref:Uncharacterized protein n=1 Tax=Nocardioides mesophilus TaxID=433659 RepID=A0A7G9RCP8_9ACTN|nr:hypothetical protein [Nocardioides mesophilus]QNN53373.1 hypothetical protein H9L09_02590 [Nocardioides mesophilus]